MQKITHKVVSLLLAVAMLSGTAHPLSVYAQTDSETSDDAPIVAVDPASPSLALEEQTEKKQNDTALVDANILVGKQPSTNSKTPVSGGGDSTASGIYVENPSFATDDDIGNSQSDGSNHSNTKLLAGLEKDGEPENGWKDWQDVYLQYDFGKVQDVKQVELYRNTYDHAVSIFKNVKVELSTDPDFKTSTIIFGGQTGQDVTESPDAKGQPQVIIPQTPVKAQYIRIWQRGHFIRNVPFGGWEGMSNGILFNEIKVIAPVPESEIPTPPPESDAQNIALNKLPYVRGLTPTNIQAITDGKVDTNYAVHNSIGERWLQFEYKNRYNIKQIKFKLEEGQYKSVSISISNNPTADGTVVWSQKDWTQGSEMITVDLKKGQQAQYVRFTVNKADDQPAKYSEIEIWATGTNFDESKPEYVAPVSKYDTLVWSDEFEGTALDQNKWQIIDGMANHGAIYNKQAVSVKDGCLVLNSKNYGTTKDLIDAVGWDRYKEQELAEHVTWSSGRVESKNKFSFQFGRVAVRAKVNDSKGIWPAIWMLCQDETGHDEIDILEYLGQNSWDAWTTNHYGILGTTKGSHGISTRNYEAWCQDFHVFEAEWDPESIIFYIDGKEVHRTSKEKDTLDAMHTRPMFMILETQVGDGWVGHVDYTKQDTKQDSNYLIDWVRVYQKKDQPVARFDDMTSLHNGTVNDSYFTAPISATKGLQEIHHSEDANTPVWQDKDNFFYGGQPRVETDRVSVTENATGEQSLVYRILQAKDVHLTTYYQTVADGNSWNKDGWYDGISIRKHLKDNANIDFKIYTSPNATDWTLFENTKTVENYVDGHPAYSRVTFDAYGLPAGTNYIKVVFPEYKGVQYNLKDGSSKEVLNTDIQLAKITFLQEKAGQEQQNTKFNVSIPNNSDQTSGAGEYHPFDSVTLKAGERAGYRFDGWVVKEGNVTLDNAANPVAHFTMPTKKVVIEAKWAAIEYTVKVVDSHSKEFGQGKYIVDNTVTLKANTREGYDFSGWTVTEGKVTLDNANSTETTFKMPAENVTIQANWTKQSAKPNDSKPAPTAAPTPVSPTPQQPQPNAPSNAPVTGDFSNWMAWATVMMLATSGFVLSAYKKYRKNN